MSIRFDPSPRHQNGHQLGQQHGQQHGHQTRASPHLERVLATGTAHFGGRSSSLPFLVVSTAGLSPLRAAPAPVG
jgi:hypothetical protein